MEQKHTKKEILSILGNLEVAGIATSGGTHIRIRMMHYAFDDEFNIYLASMKGDPKIIQLTSNPSVSLLAHESQENINQSKEVEIIGKALIIKTENERSKALDTIAERSPVVTYLRNSGNASILECIKIVPQTVKLRVFEEIVQGLPPFVVEFPENREVVKDTDLIAKKLKSWIKELRALFFTASAVSIFLGTAIAWAKTEIFHLGYFLLTLLGGLLLHAGTNVLNDYFDHRSGNDEINQEFVRPFSGGSRMIQLGLLTPLEVLVGGFLFFFLGGLIGLYLVLERGMVILLLGLIGVVSGLFYSWPRLNWASRGFGELLVGLNYGVLMALGAFYVQTQNISLEPIIASIPIGLLVTAVLYINEFPDYQADKSVGKKTLVVRLGREKAALGFIVLVIMTFSVIVGGIILSILPFVTLVALASFPFFLKALKLSQKFHEKSFDLAPANAFTVMGHLITGFLLILSYVWIGFGIQQIWYSIILTLACIFFAVYYYRHIEAQRRIFLGLKEAVLK
ncbi:MAG: 1,4-dihydroxy-2-naphthoate octaprenyltransferase [Candidatus Zixiibacteriota bacterium]